MYELEKNGTLFTSKSVGTGPSCYEKRIYRAAIWEMLRNTDLTKASRQQQLIFSDMRQWASPHILVRPFVHVWESANR